MFPLKFHSLIGLGFCLGCDVFGGSFSKHYIRSGCGWPLQWRDSRYNNCHRFLTVISRDSSGRSKGHQSRWQICCCWTRKQGHAPFSQAINPSIYCVEILHSEALLLVWTAPPLSNCSESVFVAMNWFIFYWIGIRSHFLRAQCCSHLASLLNVD